MRTLLIISTIVLTAAMALPATASNEPVYEEVNVYLRAANVDCGQFFLATSAGGGDCGAFGTNEASIIATGEPLISDVYEYTGTHIVNGDQDFTGRWHVTHVVGVVTLDVTLTGTTVDGDEIVLGSTVHENDDTATDRRIVFTIDLVDGVTEVTDLAMTMTVRGTHAGGAGVAHDGTSNITLPTLVEVEESAA